MHSGFNPEKAEEKEEQVAGQVRMSPAWFLNAYETEDTARANPGCPIAHC